MWKRYRAWSLLTIKTNTCNFGISAFSSLQCDGFEVYCDGFVGWCCTHTLYSKHKWRGYIQLATLSTYIHSYIHILIEQCSKLDFSVFRIQSLFTCKRENQTTDKNMPSSKIGGDVRLFSQVFMDDKWRHVKKKKLTQVRWQPGILKINNGTGLQAVPSGEGWLSWMFQGHTPEGGCGAYSQALSSLTPMKAFTYRRKSISNRIIQVS